jgi:hypothetical protein
MYGVDLLLCIKVDERKELDAMTTDDEGASRCSGAERDGRDAVRRDGVVSGLPRRKEVREIVNMDGDEERWR